MKTFFLFVLFLFIGIAIGGGYYIVKNKPTPPKPTTIKQEPHFTGDEPPTESRIGQIETYSGEVKWQSRTATEESQLSQSEEIKQGEKITTGVDGKTTITFDDITLTISPKTALSFNQTLPNNFVLTQPSGTIRYQNDSDIPISVRSLHLLTKLGKGNYTIEISDVTGYITVTAETGTAQIGFNDSDTISNVINLDDGQSYVFDNDELTGRLKK